MEKKPGPFGRKSNAILDGIVILIIIFVMGISVFYGYMALSEIDTDIQADPDLHNESKEVTGDLLTKYPSLMDNLFMFAFVLLTIFVIISVFLLDTHPIFFIVTVLLLMGLFTAGLLLANAFDDIATDDSVVAYSNQFPYISWLMGHLLEMFIAVGFIITVVLFIKFKT